VVVGAAIVMEEPVPIAVPPQLPVYQERVEPVPPLEVSVTVPPSLEHILALSADADVGVVATEGITVTAMLAHADEVQGAFSHLA
jgi:hypothetical protein